jgi:hypothetical protein
LTVSDGVELVDFFGDLVVDGHDITSADEGGCVLMEESRVERRISIELT